LQITCFTSVCPLTDRNIFGPSQLKVKEIICRKISLKRLDLAKVYLSVCEGTDRGPEQRIFVDLECFLKQLLLQSLLDNILAINVMGLIKEPKNVDFIIQSEPWTEQELADFRIEMNKIKVKNARKKASANSEANKVQGLKTPKKH